MRAFSSQRENVPSRQRQTSSGGGCHWPALGHVPTSDDSLAKDDGRSIVGIDPGTWQREDLLVGRTGNGFPVSNHGVCSHNPHL